MFYVSQKC